MPLITHQYRELNAELHERVPAYGTGGHKWAGKATKLAREYKCKSVLDYGSGKGSLKLALPQDLDVREYDPAFEDKRDLPHQADLVVCTDVLEHVEPTCLNDVANHIRCLAKKVILMVISCEESGKVLADGRGAHINVQPVHYWEGYFGELFKRFTDTDNEYAAVWINGARNKRS